MGPVSLRIRYRPLRIGWCIEADNLDDFSKATALSHVFWGGRFNPIIPCSDRPLAEALISAFNVDALYNVSGSPAVDAFVKEFPHIQWPEFQAELFSGGSSENTSTLLDVSHPAQHLFEAHIDRREKPSVEAVFYQWHSTDPLRHTLDATCGTYPAPTVTGVDYAHGFQRTLAAKPTIIATAAALPADLYRKFTPNDLTASELEPASPGLSHWDEPGFYYGDCSNFTDLVNFWNLRACNIDVYFYDPKYADRFRPSLEKYAALLRARPKRFPSDSTITLWQKDRDLSCDFSVFGVGISLCTFSAGLLNGLNLNPPVMGFPEKAVLAASVDNNLGTTVTFQLPEKPFFSDPELHSQMMVVSVWGGNLGNSLLVPPFLPQMNEYYGRKLYSVYNRARAERGSIGIIQNVTSDQLTLRALPFPEVICKLFEKFGIEASPSPAGLVSARLIDQMGGVQGCRVLKISGVRALIKKYAPSESFERTEAIQMIGDNDPVTHRPRFDDYKELYIEARNKPELKPEDAFLYLLKQGVFRAGLKLACPTCQLDFWVALDDAKSDSQCPYCGIAFNVLPQLRDRNWAYRRSGLFGRDDNQAGGIPVAVTLQQLEAMLIGRPWVYAPGIAFKPKSAAIENSEADIVVISEGLPQSGKALELVVAECKDAGGEITDEDVRKLGKIADAFRRSPCRPFVLFAKCGQFTQTEIKHCKSARRKLFEHGGEVVYDNNVIMLSERELEPYHIYERTEKEFDTKPYVHSFEDLAINTANIYFEPRPKTT